MRLKSKLLLKIITVKDLVEIANSLGYEVDIIPVLDSKKMNEIGGYIAEGLKAGFLDVNSDAYQKSLSMAQNAVKQLQKKMEEIKIMRINEALPYPFCRDCTEKATCRQYLMVNGKQPSDVFKGDLSAIVAQLESCDFESEHGGTLETNSAFVALKEMLKDEESAAAPIKYQPGFDTDMLRQGAFVQVTDISKGSYERYMVKSCTPGLLSLIDYRGKVTGFIPSEFMGNALYGISIIEMEDGIDG